MSGPEEFGTADLPPAWHHHILIAASHHNRRTCPALANHAVSYGLFVFGRRNRRQQRFYCHGVLNCLFGRVAYTRHLLPKKTPISGYSLFVSRRLPSSSRQRSPLAGCF